MFNNEEKKQRIIYLLTLPEKTIQKMSCEEIFGIIEEVEEIKKESV